MSSPRFLLDTNICIYLLRSRPASVVERFRRHRAGDLAMSAITFGELQFGAAKSTQVKAVREGLKRLRTLLPIISIDEAVADRYGALRAALESRGTPIGGNDLWIAAQSLAHKFTLVTNNEREFRRVPELKVQNWVS